VLILKQHLKVGLDEIIAANCRLTGLTQSFSELLHPALQENSMGLQAGFVHCILEQLYGETGFIQFSRFSNIYGETKLSF
jgi:hypothetical protein